MWRVRWIDAVIEHSPTTNQGERNPETHILSIQSSRGSSGVLAAESILHEGQIIRNIPIRRIEGHSTDRFAGGGEVLYKGVEKNRLRGANGTACKWAGSGGLVKPVMDDVEKGLSSVRAWTHVWVISGTSMLFWLQDTHTRARTSSDYEGAC